jgi:uncharacterized protein
MDTSVKVIDVDTHLLEPPTLWTDRMSPRWGDLIPHVVLDEDQQVEVWVMGGEKLMAVGGAAQAGWKDFAPICPPRWADADPATWDPKARLARMDADGIYAEVLYPNIAMFRSGTIRGSESHDFQLQMIQAYNDYQTEFCSEDPDRLLPVTSLPFWDMDETLAEIERCSAFGHRGLVFSQAPSGFGLPHLTDRHWDPLWATAQEMGLPINFHIGTANMTGLDEVMPAANGIHANYASRGVWLFQTNAKTISQVICSGICHRFPALKFVSVESGIGWIPFALEAMDWQWRNCGVSHEHPEYDLLPSEYFRRQFYGCFWFEESVAISTIEAIGADNIMYETDYPHPTSMSPGPGSAALRPDEYIRRTLGDLPEETLRKVLHDNAARLYGVG